MRETLELLHDANRMIMEFGRGIRRSSGHIYTSALVFSPLCPLKGQYGHTLRLDYVTHGVSKFWSPNHCTIELPDTVGSITYSPDGNMIAVGTHKGGIYVFDSMTGVEILTIQSPSGVYQGSVSLAFAPDGGRLASTSCHRAYIYDVTTGALLVRLEGSALDARHHISSVAFASDGMTVIASATNGTLLVWNCYTGDLISRHFSSKAGSSGEIIYPTLLSPDQDTVARPTGNGLEIWDWKSDLLLRILRSSFSVNYRQVQFLSGNAQLAATAVSSNQKDKSLEIWDFHEGILLKSLSIDVIIYISPFGREMAEFDYSGREMRIWNTETWSVVGELFRDNPNRRIDPSIAFSPNRSMFAFSPSTTQVDVWDFSKAGIGQSISNFPQQESVIGSGAIGVSVDGSRVVYILPQKEMWQTSSTLKVWDLGHAGSPKSITVLDLLDSLTCSPDGLLFVSTKNLERK